MLDAKPRHWRAWYDGRLVSNYEAPLRWVPATLTADQVREVNARNAVEVELIDEAARAGAGGDRRQGLDRRRRRDLHHRPRRAAGRLRPAVQGAVPRRRADAPAADLAAGPVGGRAGVGRHPPGRPRRPGADVLRDRRPRRPGVDGGPGVARLRRRPRPGSSGCSPSGTASCSGSTSTCARSTGTAGCARRTCPAPSTTAPRASCTRWPTTRCSRSNRWDDPSLAALRSDLVADLWDHQPPMSVTAAAGGGARLRVARGHASVAWRPVSQLKTRLQALSLLDRALAAMTEEELATLVDKLPEDHRQALDKIAGARDEDGFSDPAARDLAVRATAARGRMNGGLEQVATILCDPCLAECLEALGDHADNPSEEQLKEVLPPLIDKWGVATVRMMLAGSIAGEAVATPMLTRLLKSDDELALPAGGTARDRPAAGPARRRRDQGQASCRQGRQAGRGPRPPRAAGPGQAPRLRRRLSWCDPTRARASGCGRRRACPRRSGPTSRVGRARPAGARRAVVGRSARSPRRCPRG